MITYPGKVLSGDLESEGFVKWRKDLSQSQTTLVLFLWILVIQVYKAMFFSHPKWSRVPYCKTYWLRVRLNAGRCLTVLLCSALRKCTNTFNGYLLTWRPDPQLQLQRVAIPGLVLPPTDWSSLIDAGSVSCIAFRLSHHPTPFRFNPSRQY